MKKHLLKTLKIVSIIILPIYLIICTMLYFNQERLLFHPLVTPKVFVYQFSGNFEEKYFAMKDGVSLHTLLFKTDSAKGLIFYLHGNAGNLQTWGSVAGTYTDLGYDVFMIDYRGFGKSGGMIDGEDQMHEDIQTVYDEIKKQYAENNIVILGYSLGTGMAAKLAVNNAARKLILQAPFYSLKSRVEETISFIPNFILKYKFENHKHIASCKMPVVVFHGDKDYVIDYNHSVKLSKHIKKTDLFITLYNEDHHGMSENETYLTTLAKEL